MFSIDIVPDDDPSLEAFIVASTRLDPRQRGLELAQVRSWDQATDRHLRLVARREGSVIAVAQVSGAYNEPDADVIPMHVVVDPEHRGAGLGTELFARLSAWARVRRSDVRLMLVIPEPDASSLAFWQRRGFAEVERYSIVELDLTAQHPPIDVRSDVEIVSLHDRPDVIDAAWDLQIAVWTDMPGQAQGFPSRDAWDTAIAEGRRPLDGCFVALDSSGTPIGITITAVSASDHELASNGFTGVARAARGRGVALALKARQVAWCRDAGYLQLETANHADNAPMRAINERLGYRPRPTQLVLHGPPATAPS